MGFWNNLFGSSNNASDGVFTLAIGEKFPIGRKSTGEGSRIEATGMGLFYILYFSNPTKQEINKIKSDAICISFIYKQPVLDCVLQVGDDLYGDAPYSAALYKEKIPESAMLPSSVYVCLVDADSYILKSMRIIGLPNEIRNFIFNVQQEQLTINMPPYEFDKCVSYLQNSVPLEHLVEMANCSLVIKQNNTVSGLIWDDNGGVTEVKLK